MAADRPALHGHEETTAHRCAPGPNFDFQMSTSGAHDPPGLPLLRAHQSIGLQWQDSRGHVDRTTKSGLGSDRWIGAR